MTDPRIYVACLASYNSGILHGRWIDLDGLDADDVKDEIAEMLRESPEPNVTVKCPECDGDGHYGAGRAKCNRCKGTGSVPSAEEYAIHDSEGLPSGYAGNEYLDIGDLMERLEELADLDDSEREAFDAFCDVEGESDVETFRERYIGEFAGWTEVAEHYVEEAGLLSNVPDSVARYFDFESYGRDMRVGGDAWESRGHFFWNH